MAFATKGQVAARLGRTLTTEEEATVDLLLDDATTLIAQAADQTDEWADNLDPVPKILNVVCRQMVHRVMLNPDGVARLQETLGEHSRSISHREKGDDGSGATGELELTEREQTLVREEILGQLSGSAMTESVATQICPRRIEL
ncbi:MAG TPA: hypothetical protein VGD39_15525 [Nocardioides sp.]